MILSRVGDLDGVCSADDGCANGSYYMTLNVKKQGRDAVDPVIQLREKFDAWRQEWIDRPDHLLTERTWTAPSLPGNGTSEAALLLDPRDWRGVRLGRPGLQVTVSHRPDSAGLATIGPVVDGGDGTYKVSFTAGVGQGTDRFEVVIDDGLGPVTLYPFETLRHDPTLVADVESISAVRGGEVTLTLAGPGAVPGRRYLILASALGTEPGTPVGDLTIPLNFDAVTIYSWVFRNGKTFVDTEGLLDPAGAGGAQVILGPGALDPLVGDTLDLALLTLDPLDFASNPVSLVVDP
jgi:hypothetical protein